MTVNLKPSYLQELRETLGDRVQEHAPLARYTAARIGGPADALVEVHSTQEMVEVVTLAWECDLSYVILGGGSNVLVSDVGVRGLVIINRARAIRFDERGDPPTVWAESGVNFGSLARQAAQRGFGGLEWAVGIPGTLGGAVVGNAGAHGGDIAGNLRMAEILHRLKTKQPHAIRRETWTVDELEFVYRSSVLKHHPGEVVVLGAELCLEQSTQSTVQAEIDKFTTYRRSTQPPGASMGSMFKNPPDDYAGRLIEAAGLKGKRIGDVQISSLHANFFVNLDQARAEDVLTLIQAAREAVKREFGVQLELEIELLGEW